MPHELNKVKLTEEIFTYSWDCAPQEFVKKNYNEMLNPGRNKAVKRVIDTRNFARSCVRAAKDTTSDSDIVKDSNAVAGQDIKIIFLDLLKSNLLYKALQKKKNVSQEEYENFLVKSGYTQESKDLLIEKNEQSMQIARSIYFSNNIVYRKLDNPDLRMIKNKHDDYNPSQKIIDALHAPGIDDEDNIIRIRRERPELLAEGIKNTENFAYWEQMANDRVVL